MEGGLKGGDKDRRRVDGGGDKRNIENWERWRLRGGEGSGMGWSGEEGC